MLNTSSLGSLGSLTGSIGSSSKKPVILIQGASGQLGFPVVAQLLRNPNKDYVVRAGVIDPNTEKARKLMDLGAQVVLLDSNRADTVCNALKGVCKLMIIPPRLENNTEIATTLIDFAKMTGTVKHIVLVSVLGAETENTFFAKQFHPIEQHLEKSGIAWTHLRSAFFMDNLWQYAETIRRTGVITLPIQQARIPMISIRDVGEAAANILSGRATGNHLNKVYELTGPEPLRGEDIARIFMQVTGNSNIRFQPFSLEDTKKFLHEQGLKKWLIRAMIDLYAMMNAGRITDRPSPDLERLLLRRPVTFNKFVKHNINTFSTKVAMV